MAMQSQKQTMRQRVGTAMATTGIITRVAGAERGRHPSDIVRVALEGREDELLLQLSEEAATQLLAYLLELLPKRGLRK